MELRILLIEDVPTDAELEVRELKRAGLRVVHRIVETEEAFRLALREFRPEIIISDFTMPHFDGMFALTLARELAPDVPFIFVSGTIGEEYAIRALKNGATDYVLKNNLVRLPAAVERALQESAERAARLKTERELEETRSRLHSIVSSLSDVVWSYSLRDKRLLYVSTAIEEIFGWPAAEFYENPGRWLETIHPDDRVRVRAEREAGLAAGRFESVFRIVLRDGGLRWIQDRARVIFDEDGRPVQLDGLARDITQVKEQEARIERLSRIRAVLSGINSAIVRIRDRQQLFDEACRIALEHGGFGMAWIGLFDPATQEVTPVAWAGLEASEYLGGVKSTIRDDLPQGRGVLAQAIRSRKPVFDNDITLDPAVGGKRRAEAIRRGYRSFVILPLIVEGEVMGSLSLFAKEPDFFDDEEVKLLTELAGDISFALEHIAGQERIEKLSRVRAITSGINAAIVRARNPQSLFEEACRIAVEQGRLGSAWIGMLDPATLDITPVAWAGEGTQEMRTAKSTARDESPRGQGAVSRAIRERRLVFNNDLSLQSFGGPRLDAVLKLGFRSMIALPLFEGDKVVGTFTLYAREPGFFDEDEIVLLTELAGNVSFALDHLARQQRIEKLSRIRMVSGEINAAIVRIRERETLLRETCRIAAEHGKFELVWVALLDEEKKQVKPVAWTGFSEETASAVNWAGISTSKGTLGEAIQTRKPSVRNDIEAELPGGKLRQEALQKGCHSTVSLPLVVDDNVVALILLGAPGVGFFDKEELSLLNEVAADVSFALQSISRQERLEYLSYYDPLTGLPNRTLFNDRLDQRVSAARRDQDTFSVVMLDVERFRNINEILGRAAGDGLLREVAKRLKSAADESDILGHRGGDQFAIATRRTADAGEVAHILDQFLTTTFGHPFEAGGAALRLASRAGVAVYPEDGADGDSLLRNAEAALRNAKNAGETYQFYAPQMNASVAETLRLESRMREALEREQFVLHYQPKVDLARGTISGLEALIRWNDPETGLVPPAKFIPLLEETGLILNVGRWAIRNALEELRKWAVQGLQPPRVAVNVSAVQLRQKDFVDMVREAIGEAAGGSHGLDLEITESLIMADVEGNIAKLRAIRDLAVNVFIDDFGTGYSSLSYLAKLPIMALKIDRSFIVAMTSAPDNMNIVSTIVSLAHSMNLKVIAEGVETEEQANLLRLLRCDEAQGYLFGRPVPPDELEGKLRQA